MNSLNSRTTQITIRGLQYCVHEWGDASKPMLFMLHGWMDCGASFKFIAPHIVDQFRIVAPDLRGFGDSEHAPGGYWFPDYLADLDALLEHYSLHDKVNIVGHSMGGNIALMYAGIQHSRVGKVMVLDSLGLLDTQSSDAPIKLRQWLGEISRDKASKVYASQDALKSSIRASNPTLSEFMVDQLSVLWAKPLADGTSFVLKHDPRHRNINPIRYNFSDVLEIWKQVEAPVSLVMARNSWILKRLEGSGRIKLAQTTLNVLEDDYMIVENSNHMLHLEQPEATAACIKKFFL